MSDAAADRDYSVVAGHVRNRLRAGQATSLMIDKRRVFFIPTGIFGDTLPAVLVASEKRESLLVHPHTPLNRQAFVAGGFSLTRARTLASIFDAIRGKQSTKSQISKG